MSRRQRRAAIGSLAALLGLALPLWPVVAPLWPLVAAADEAAAVKVVPGLYKATGKTPDGKTYDGDVEIAPLGKVLAVLWRLGGGDAYKGIGLEAGSVFGVAYGTRQALRPGHLPHQG